MSKHRMGTESAVRWVGVAVFGLAIASPDLASAGRQIVRRSLPRGVPAASPAQGQTRGDAAVEAGVNRLLTAVESGLPLSAEARA